MQGTLAPWRTSSVQLTPHSCTLASDSFDLTETTNPAPTPEKKNQSTVYPQHTGAQ